MVEIKPIQISPASRTQYEVIKAEDRKERSFYLSEKNGDDFIKSGILNGKATAIGSGEKEVDYIQQGYIDAGDVVYIVPTPLPDEPENDWVIVFEDQSNTWSTVVTGTDKAVTGLRIIVDKGDIKVLALKTPEIDNSWWWNGKDEKTEVIEKLSEGEIVENDNRDLIFDSSREANDPKKFKALIRLVAGSFNSNASHQATVEGVFKKLLRKAFSDIENRIHNVDDFHNFQDQEILLKKYTQLYSLIKDELGEKKANKAIYGKNSDGEIIDGFNDLIKNFSSKMQEELEAKLSSEADINDALSTFLKFTQGIKSQLNITRSESKVKESFENNQATVAMNLINKYLGSNIQYDDSLKKKINNLLVTSENGKQAINATILNEIFKEAKLNDLDKSFDKEKFAKLNDTKPLSELMKKLGLEAINDSNTSVFQLKKSPTSSLSSYVVIQSEPGNKFSFRGIDLLTNKSTTSLSNGHTYEQIKALLEEAHDAAYDPIDLDSKHKLAIIEFAKKSFKDDFVKSFQLAYLKELTDKGIKGQDDANLFFTLETSGLTDDQKTKAITAFFGIGDNQLFKEIKELQSVYDILTKYAADPTEALKKQLLQNTMPAEIKKLAEKLSGEKLYLAQEKSEGLDKTISDYSEKRNKTVTKLISSLTYALIKLKGTSIENQSQVGLKESVAEILNSLKFDRASQELIQQQLESLVKKPELDEKQPLISLGQKITQILNSDLKKISSIPASPTLENKPVTQLQQDLIAINSIASTADSNQIKDFIYLLSNGRKLHPVQLNLMENILGKYSSSSFEYTNNDFEKLINETLANKIKTSDSLAWGFSPNDRKIEEIITNLDPKFQVLKVSVPDYKFMLMGKKALKLENEVLGQELATTLKKLVGNKPELIQEITRRLVLRNSLPTTNYADVSVINPFPEIKDPNTFDLEHFIKVLRKDDKLTKEFLEEISSSFEGSIDRLDAIRQYEIARIMVTKGFDYSSLKSLEPQNKGYTDRLEQLANSSRELWIQKGVLGCHRSSFNGDASTQVEFKVAVKDVEEILLKEMKPLGDGKKVKQVKNYENALKLFKAIDFSYSYIAEDESEVVVKVNDEATLIDFLNTFGQSGKEPKVLVAEISSRINSKLANYQALSKGNDSTESYDDKKSLLESTKSIFSVFGRNKIVKDIPGQFEVVSVDEVMYSFAAVMQKVEAFKAKHPAAFVKKNNENQVPVDEDGETQIGLIESNIYSPQLLDYFNQDLEQVNLAFKKKKEDKMSYFSTNINVA